MYFFCLFLTKNQFSGRLLIPLLVPKLRMENLKMYMKLFIVPGDNSITELAVCTLEGIQVK